MKKQKKILISLLIFFSILLSSCKVFAVEYLKAELSESFLDYLELSEEDKANTIMPRSYNIEKTTATVKNPLRLVQKARSSALPDFSLKTYIPENMVIKNQMSTNSCWTFSSLAVLESNLALKDYRNRISTINLNNENNQEKEPITVYDFSERHMEYATSQTFKGNVINPIGFRREVNIGGNFNVFIPYLTNGTGAIPESEMEFKNDTTQIELDEIKGKTVVTQVNDVITFPKYQSTDDKTLVIQQMKEHIQNYGAIDAVIHGAELFNSSCYNNKEGALYCTHEVNGSNAHAVAIIGWDDTYEVENFINKPNNPGAWIIKNSWGTEWARFTLQEMKEMVFSNFANECQENGWTNATQVSDEFAKAKFIEDGYQIENDEAVIYIGDKGFSYVSYEDYNIYLQLTGIVDAETRNYENIYQYNTYGSNVKWGAYEQKMYIATVFNKKTEGKEYLTQVSIQAPETYTCKVYVNSDGTEKSSIQDLVPVQLESGESETFDAGYHTIKFAEPVKIENDEFLVVLEIQGTQEKLIMASFEGNMNDFWGKSTIWDNVTVEEGKSFISFGNTFNDNTWLMTSNLEQLSEGSMMDADTTLKAFTTSKILETISIENSPKTTQYVVGQDFDVTNMVVKANYANGDKIDITKDITILDGEDLKIGQTEVTIIYKGKSVTQPIEVVQNTVENIVVKNVPNNDEYWAGENFNVTGMTIEAIYRDGTRKIVQVTDNMIKDGQVLKNNQTTVTIEYEGKTVVQEIKVKVNTVVELKITKGPNKEKYVVGQDFISEGMIVVAKYAKGNEVIITDYEIVNGTNLQLEQTNITLKYEGIMIEYQIRVEVKSVTGAILGDLPTKTEYIQNKENLDLTGGTIKISYNDNTSEVISMVSEKINVSGFDNKVVGKQTVALTYKGYNISFEVEVKELPKPVNSDFSKAQGTVKSIKGYSFSDTSKQSYIIVDVELSNITKALNNDSVEYYYYLSSNNAENNIASWVKIENLISNDGKLSFKINTLDIANYDNVVDADNLYLYVREVATRNGMISEIIGAANILEAENIKIEEFVDGEKKAEINSEEIIKPTPGEQPDNTVAPEIIPNAGGKLLLIVFGVVICILGGLAYWKYKDIEI